MKFAVAAVLLLCLAHAQARSYVHGTTKPVKATAGVNITTDGEASVLASAASSASAFTMTRDAVYTLLVRVFVDASNLFGSYAGSMHDEFCSSAVSTIDAQAASIVFLMADAYAETNTCVDVMGDASASTVGEAIAKSRAETFISMMIDAAVAAEVGINRADATAAVVLEGDIFAQAFAAVTAMSMVEGDGQACAGGVANASIAVEAVARIILKLTASADCQGAVATGSVTSGVDTTSGAVVTLSETRRSSVSGGGQASVNTQASAGAGFEG